MERRESSSDALDDADEMNEAVGEEEVRRGLSLKRMSAQVRAG